MTTTKTASTDEAIGRWILRRIAAGGQCFGCTERCRFRVGHEFSVIDLQHHIYLYHGNHDRHEVIIPSATVMPTFEGQSTVERIAAAAEPWLRGLHRFPVEMGIK